MLRYSVRVAIAGILLLLLSACENSKFVRENLSINGTAIDGYIAGAAVCLDLDGNGVCSAAESNTTTAVDGTFSFSNIEKGAKEFGTVLLTGGTDTATNKEFGEELKKIIDTKNVHSTILITPLTDLAATSFLNSSTQNSTKLQGVTQMIEEGLSLFLNNLDLDKDPMQDIKTFFTVQDLQYIKKMVQNITSINQDINATQKQEMKYKIKKELLTPIEDKQWEDSYFLRLVFLEMQKTYENLNELVNERDFAIRNLIQFRALLKVLSEDSRLTINMLGNLQALLEEQRDISIAAAINSQDYNATIDLNTTFYKITQTDFNTTDAIYDENACLKNSVYNSMEATSFSPDYTYDTTNGISLRSILSFDFDIEKTKTKLFYPDLTVEKINQRTKFNSETYYLEFDQAWISNVNNNIYIQTPSGNSALYNCYRLNLSSTNANALTTTKVFRYSAPLI